MTEQRTAEQLCQQLWETGQKGVLILTPAGMRALEMNIELTDRCEQLIQENDRLRMALEVTRAALRGEHVRKP